MPYPRKFVVSGSAIITILLIPVILYVWRLWKQVTVHRTENDKEIITTRHRLTMTRLLRFHPKIHGNVQQWLKVGDLVFSTNVPAANWSQFWYNLTQNRMAFSAIITRGRLPVHCGVVIKINGTTSDDIILLEQTFNGMLQSTLTSWYNYAQTA